MNLNMYTITQIAELISRDHGRVVTPDLVRKVCQRRGIGINVNTRIRLISEADLPAVVSAVLASRVGNPNFVAVEKKNSLSRVEKSKVGKKSGKNSRKSG